MIYTTEYIKTMPKMEVQITYPDGAKCECAPDATGYMAGYLMRQVHKWANHMQPLVIPDATTWKPWPKGTTPGSELDRELDGLREAHRKVSHRPTSAWAK